MFGGIIIMILREIPEESPKKKKQVTIVTCFVGIPKLD